MMSFLAQFGGKTGAAYHLAATGHSNPGKMVLCRSL